MNALTELLQHNFLTDYIGFKKRSNGNMIYKWGLNYEKLKSLYGYSLPHAHARDPRDPWSFWFNGVYRTGLLCSSFHRSLTTRIFLVPWLGDHLNIYHTQVYAKYFSDANFSFAVPWLFLPSCQVAVLGMPVALRTWTNTSCEADNWLSPWKLELSKEIGIFVQEQARSDQRTYPALQDNQGFFMEIQTFLLESDIYYQAVAYSPEDIEATLQENQE